MNDRPKLLFFSHIGGTDVVTGAEKLLLLVIREMEHHFHCVLVVPEAGILAQQAGMLGVETTILELPIMLDIYAGKAGVESELQALRLHPAWGPLNHLLLREKPAYVYVNTSVHPMPAIAATELGIPVIWSLMETLVDTVHRSQSTAIIDRFSARILGISETVLTPFTADVRASKAYVLRPYISLADYQPELWSDQRLQLRANLGLAEHHLVAGFIAATIYPNKGLLEFIQATLPIAKKHPHFCALIVGMPVDREYVRRCKDLIWRTGLSKQFIWIHFTERMETIYPALDVLVVSSLIAEGFGMTALEGMFFGKPVVAFASGGLQEILEQTDNGAYLVAPGHVQELTSRITTLLQDSALRHAVGQRNAEAVQARYGVEKFRESLGHWLHMLPPPATARSIEACVPTLPREGLVRGHGPTVYLIAGDQKHPFSSPEALLQRHYRFEDIQEVQDYLLDRLGDGEPLYAIPAAAIPHVEPPASEVAITPFLEPQPSPSPNKGKRRTLIRKRLRKHKSRRRALPRSRRRLRLRRRSRPTAARKTRRR